MDLSVRELLIIVGVLLAVAVLLDGYRRMRRERDDTLRLSSAKRREAEDGLVNPELPGGPARVVAVREQPSLHLRRADSSKAADQSSSEPQPPAPAEAAQQTPAEQQQSEAVDHDILFTDPAEQFAEPIENEKIDAPEQAAEPNDREPTPPSVEVSAKDPLQAIQPPEPAKPVSTQKPPSPASSSPKNEFQELLVLNVVADDDKPYRGSDLLQILLGCDLRYGRMKIFHRHEQPNGEGAEQFSVANLVEPGNFELDGIENFSTPGVVFFLELPGPENPIKAFEVMQETANCLVNNLGGELRDQSHSVATKQTLEHYKQRIRDFERRQMTLV